MNPDRIQKSITRLECYKDDLTHTIKDNDNPYIIRDLQDDIDAICVAIDCMRQVGGIKVV